MKTFNSALAWTSKSEPLAKQNSILYRVDSTVVKGRHSKYIAKLNHSNMAYIVLYFLEPESFSAVLKYHKGQILDAWQG